jgi:putative methyltransferase (TIGR04325 family)
VDEHLAFSVRVRLALKAVTPPLLWGSLKAVKDRVRGASEIESVLEVSPQPPVVAPEPEPPEWEYVPEGWWRPAGGWDSEAIARVYRQKWPSFLEAVEGPGPLGVNHEIQIGTPVPRDDYDAQQMVLAFGYALARATRGKKAISILDWGGGPGHYAVLAQALAPDAELEYHSRDVPALAKLGRELLPQHSFHDDLACLSRKYDFVLASSSLQYSEEWQETLTALARATSGYLYVTRVPVALRSASFVVLQRARRYGYETEYIGWVINRDELVQTAETAGLRFVREVLLPARFSAAGAPEDPVEHRGFLFSVE